MHPCQARTQLLDLLKSIEGYNMGLLHWEKDEQPGEKRGIIVLVFKDFEAFRSDGHFTCIPSRTQDHAFQKVAVTMPHWWVW